MDDDNEVIDLLNVVRVQPDPNAPARRPFPPPEPLVVGAMFLNQNGNINSRSAANINRIFELDSRWSDTFFYDTFSNQYLSEQNGIERLIDEDRVSHSQRWLEEVYEARFGRDAVRSSMYLQCSYNKRHPIQNYLEKLPKPELDENGDVKNPLVENFFIKHFGVDDTPLNRAYSRGFFISAVMRAKRPGCKVDNMVVLVGPQGTKKSSAFAALCKDKSWFSDTKLKIGTKDSLEQVRSTWIYEISELASIRKADNDVVKQFLSSQVDSFRPAYERQVRDIPRTCVFVGSVNTDNFLTDWSGSRRFWVMRVTKTVDDIKAIEDAADLLWAEALYLHQKGVSYYLDPLLETQREQRNQDFTLDDGWESKIDTFLGQQAIFRSNKKKFHFTINDVLSDLGFEAHQIKHSNVVRVSTILRSAGCECERKHRVDPQKGGSRKITYWTPPETYQQ